MGHAPSPPWRALPALVAALGALYVLSNMHTFAFTDYETEALPAIDLLVRGDVSAFLAHLPGYGGALVLEAPFAYVGGHLGGDAQVMAWRAQALPGIALLGVIGGALGTMLAERTGGARGAVAGCVLALLVACCPFAVRAESSGHPEELLVVGLSLVAVLCMQRDRVLVAGALAGLATAAKPWAVVALAVVLAGAPDRRGLLRGAAAAVVAGTALVLPALLAGPAAAAAAVPTSTVGVFKPSNLFWFFGDHNPLWSSSARPVVLGPDRAPADAAWAQRLAPGWAATLSHPLIVVVGAAFAGAYRVLRGADRRTDLLLLLCVVLWWRCLLDTWNVDYYALGAVLALAAWEAGRGRPPVAASALVAVGWLTFEGALSPRSVTPDVHTAVYLAWAVPVGIATAWRALHPATFAAATSPALRLVERRIPAVVAGLGARQVGRRARDGRPAIVPSDEV